MNNVTLQTQNKILKIKYQKLREKFFFFLFWKYIKYNIYI